MQLNFGSRYFFKMSPSQENRRLSERISDGIFGDGWYPAAVDRNLRPFVRTAWSRRDGSDTLTLLSGESRQVQRKADYAYIECGVRNPGWPAPNPDQPIESTLDQQVEALLDSLDIDYHKEAY